MKDELKIGGLQTAVSSDKNPTTKTIYAYLYRISKRHCMYIDLTRRTATLIVSSRKYNT